MKIVIIGDGKVGYKLAEHLSVDNYDVVLIDNNEEKLKEAINNLDINCFAGDGVSVEVQAEAGVPEADLVIACTSTDELNMLSCLVAKRLGAKHTIARVRNPLYYHQIDLLKEDLHLSMVINPEFAVANEIARNLIFPDASKVETFVKGRLELVEVPVREGSPIIGYKLAEIYSKFQIKILICAIQRGSEVFIPDGEFVIEEGDKLHIAATHREIEQFFSRLGNRKRRVRNVLICGGGRVGFYLAKKLCSMGMDVKIIEQSQERCEDLCEELPKVTVIHGDATDHDLLLEEGVREADALVALTGVDEENIIMGLFAKKQGVQKIVAKVNEDSRAQMVEGLGIDSIVSSKNATVDAIFSYVRARQNSLSSANIESMYRLVDDRVEALEFVIKEETKYTNIALKDLRTKPNNLIACIARKRQMIIPSGNDSIRVGDTVVVITKSKKIQDITDILE
ncbi:MAG: Trk system potassium transporter TrkA [Tyzzerella sp.]|nr:Trk system potassium transporter TrkA [Tyzzerella sp.]